jgi:hypothetical protein
MKMSCLYELTGDFYELYNNFEEFEGDEETEQAWFDTLEAIEMQIEDKVENIGKIIKSLSNEVEGHKAAEREIAARRRAKENCIERLKKYIIESMNAVNLKKVDRDDILVSVRATAASVKIDDEEAFIKWAAAERDDLLKYAAPTINKTLLKKEIQDGEEYEGVRLEQGQTVIIK